jgi:hypothetical protein
LDEEKRLIWKASKPKKIKAATKKTTFPLAAGAGLCRELWGGSLGVGGREVKQVW